MELADRVVVMSQGRIEQVGTPDEVYDRPKSPFVFSFIGEACELPVTVKDGQVWLDGRPIGLDGTGTPEGPARLFLRPHGVDVICDGSAAIAGEVSLVRRSGGWRRIELLAGAGKHKVEIELPADTVHDLSGRIAIVPRHWRLFPA